MFRLKYALVVLTTLAVCTDNLSGLFAADWPMLGRDNTRNAVSPEKNPPMYWVLKGTVTKSGKGGEVLETAKASKNIKWKAELGIYCFSTPVVSDGLIWVGTINVTDESSDRVLKCFRESDGKLLYQYASPRLPDRVNESVISGISCSPLIEGDRLWFTTNRCETVCLDIAPLKQGKGDPKVVWKYDMRKKLGIFPRALFMGPARTCSIAAYKDWIYVVTGNGMDRVGKIPAPQAPGLVCFNKQTGKVVWTDHSSSNFLLHGEWSSPLVVEINGQPQVIVPQGDGWIRSFHAKTGKIIWRFDINPKKSKSLPYGKGDRNYFLTTPVLYENRVYIASGQGVEHSTGPGRLVCIDPTKTGDISSELVVDKNGKRLPQRRIYPFRSRSNDKTIQKLHVQAVNTSRGENVIPNPNSGLVWEYGGIPQNEYDKLEFEDQQMHRTISNVVVHKGLVIAPDIAGAVHCLDAKTGKKYWSVDMFTGIWASPLIVDDKAYVCDESGTVAIFPLSTDPKRTLKKDDENFLVPRIEFDSGISMYTSPIFANGVMYIAGRRGLYAIQETTTTNSKRENKK